MNKIKILLALTAVFFVLGIKAQNNSSREIINEDNLVRHIKVLASDEYEGRAPGTKGEKLSVEYLTGQFKMLKLIPPFKKGFTQKVPVVRISELPRASFVLNGKPVTELKYADDYMFYSPGVANKISITNKQVVFAGYGINAPELGWNDYKDISVKGKIVLLLPDTPERVAKDTNSLRTKSVLLRARAQQKFEEAFRQGAEAVLIIQTEKSQGGGWNSSVYKRARTRYFIQDSLKKFRCALEGYINEKTAANMFLQGGADYEREFRLASKKDYKGKVLNINATLQYETLWEQFTSMNVAGIIPGKDKKEECIIITAHWDHLGVDSAAKGNDKIFNGANDDATGCAILLTLAQAIKQSGENNRTVLFLITTCEEKGLLGSEYYTRNSVFPMKKTLACINIDGLFPFGLMKDVSVIGIGLSDLDDYIEKAAAGEGRIVTDGENYSQGYFYRLDSFNLARNGVPSAHIGTGQMPVDSVLTNSIKEKLGNFYHQVTDEYKPGIWNMEGIVRDVQLIYNVIIAVSKAKKQPSWHAGNEFYEIRKKSLRK